MDSQDLARIALLAVGSHAIEHTLQPSLNSLYSAHGVPHHQRQVYNQVTQAMLLGQMDAMLGGGGFTSDLVLAQTLNQQYLTPMSQGRPPALRVTTTPVNRNPASRPPIDQEPSRSGPPPYESGSNEPPPPPYRLPET